MTRPEGNYYLGLFLAARLTLWIGGDFCPGRRDALWLLIALAGAAYSAGACLITALLTTAPMQSQYRIAMATAPVEGLVLVS